MLVLVTLKYRVAQKNVYTLYSSYFWNKLWQCLVADGGHFEHLHWIQNSRTCLISILLLYKYSSYDYRVIFFMSKCVYIILGHSVVITVHCDTDCDCKWIQGNCPLLDCTCITSLVCDHIDRGHCCLIEVNTLVVKHLFLMPHCSSMHPVFYTMIYCLHLSLHFTVQIMYPIYKLAHMKDMHPAC
jgi:hypothetical protein